MIVILLLLKIMIFYQEMIRRLYLAFQVMTREVFGCIMAIAAGAKLLEKHVKFKDVKWGHFDSVALNLGSNEFKNFCKRN